MILESYTEGKQTLEDVSKNTSDRMEAAIRQMSDYGLSDRRSISRRPDDEYDCPVLLRHDRDGVPVRMLHRYQSAMDLQANLSALAARRCVSPVHRMRWILSETAVSFGIHFVNMLVLLAYMKYILRLEFAGSYAEMIPVVIIGSMIGVTMGMFITSIGKNGRECEDRYYDQCLSGSSFLAGLMNADIKM